MNKTFSPNMMLALSLINIVGLTKSTALNAAELKKTPPSMAFLEYLAEQVEVDGKLVGPLDMQQNARNTVIDTSKKLDKKDDIDTSSNSSNNHNIKEKNND